MTSGKKGSNPPREFICELCGNSFTRLAIKSMPEPRFCSVICRNRYISIEKKKGSNHRPKSCSFPCPICGDKTKERRKRANMCKKCFRKQQNIDHNPPHLVIFIKEHYSSMGAKWIAGQTGHDAKLIQRIAYKFGIKLSKDKYYDIVHEAASRHMTENNPMFSQKTRDKVAEYWELHPEEKEKVTIRLMEGHQRIQKDKPTKLELRLYEYLDQLGVDFEPQFLIKPKFIVDALVGDNIVIQADGDYWHGHPRFGNLTERQIAQQKRDKAQDKYLETRGYKVIRIWESDMSKDAVVNALNRQ